MATKKAWTEDKYRELGEMLAQTFGHSRNPALAIAEHYMVMWDQFTSSYERPDPVKLGAAITAELRIIRKSQPDGVLTMDEDKLTLT